jgi:DNA-binding SARP family transcriptional activator
MIPARGLAVEPPLGLLRHGATRHAYTARPTLQIGVLGPLQICAGGREARLPQAKLRLLFTTLILRENRVISNDALIRGLWGEEPPPTALRALRVYISQLRKFFAVLGLDEEQCSIITQPPGYRLVLPPGTLDRHLFDEYRRLAKDAVEMGDIAGASSHYQSALALCRGRALADVRGESALIESSALWLDETRLSVALRYIDLQLQLSQHLDMISELTMLANDHPFNEGVHSRLMVALYRSGRTGDALAVYRTIRNLLVDELGTDPGPGIRQVQQMILSAEPLTSAEQDLWTL